MADLKAGTVANPGAFANSMALYMEEAMKKEWQAVKGYPLPTGLGEADRRILFAAVAQGVLRYLEDNLSSLATTSAGGSGSHSHTLTFGVTAHRNIP
jgi:hypothetical protein